MFCMQEKCRTGAALEGASVQASCKHLKLTVEQGVMPFIWTRGQPKKRKLLATVIDGQPSSNVLTKWHVYPVPRPQRSIQKQKDEHQP